MSSVDYGTASAIPTTSPQQKPGDQAAAVAAEQLHKPYYYGATGPDTFDCSGLMYYSYYLASNSPHIDIGRDTNAEWSSPNMTTIYDAFALGTGGVPWPQDPNKTSQPTANDLEVGDLLLYFQPGNGGTNAHVKMYVGGGQTIEAPHSGAFVEYNPVDFTGDAAEPFRGVRRVTGGGSSGAGSSTNYGPNYGASTSPSGGSSSTSPAALTPTLSMTNLHEPLNNLPFSAFFTGTRVAGTVSRGSNSKAAGLVRGGMSELLNNPSGSSGSKEVLKGRPGGVFACYFMMNPSTLSTDCTIATNLAAPSTISPDAQNQGPLFIQNQTISFSLIFNRMYEVWQGGVGNPHPQNGGKAGPSDIGVRWDVRSVERLMGIYDAQKNFPGATPGTINGQTGVGVYGAGDRPPMSLPIQVVLGGPNSIQFQGRIASMDYNYTLFDSNMVPIECTVDITVMRSYLPDYAGGAVNAPDIVTPLYSSMGQMGSVFTTSAKSPFNVPTVGKGGTGQS